MLRTTYENNKKELDMIRYGTLEGNEKDIKNAGIEELENTINNYIKRIKNLEHKKNEIKLRNFEASVPAGFFTYPVSQAADITAFDATTVPVGEDQMPMLEQTQEIVHKFNSIYGETLVMPKILLPENQSCYRLVGTDGKAKMSKSLGNTIYLSDDSKTVKQKVMGMLRIPVIQRIILFSYI